MGFLMNIAVFLPNWIGDAVMATPAVRALREHHPGARLFAVLRPNVAGVFGGCDIIAMATHGRGGLERWAMGSVTERVLGATQLPLLVVRPQEAESKQELNGEEFAEAGIVGIHMGSSVL